MKHKGMLYLSVLLLVGVISLWGCPKKADVSGASDTQTQTEKVTSPATPASAAEAKTNEATTTEAKADGSNEKSGVMAEGLKPVYFDFNRSLIRNDAKDVMKANAKWLKANPKAKVKIEGNCDERGTVEYNQALGQRRAASAKKYLTDMGISSRRISLISYGKEKPSCTESTEECWQKNRRDNFMVVSE